jgi:hypothetical protein
MADVRSGLKWSITPASVTNIVVTFMLVCGDLPICGDYFRVDGSGPR